MTLWHDDSCNSRLLHPASLPYSPPPIQHAVQRLAACCQVRVSKAALSQAADEGSRMSSPRAQALPPFLSASISVQVSLKLQAMQHEGLVFYLGP